MAVVNKFNVNKQEVTLDADIIENMSANDVSYDVSTQYDEKTVGDKLSELEYDVTANNNGATFSSLSELLSSENLSTLIPPTVRCGGMTIRFVQSSDNKYVKYRLMDNVWSINTEEWTIADEGVYIENPEFIYIKTDADDNVLYGVKQDGDFYFGAGIPSQVKEEFDKKTDITNITNLTANKVDKEEGKSLIDSEYASSQSAVDNSEYIEVTTDAEGKILTGRTPDGTKFENIGFNTPKLSIDSATIENIKDTEERTEILTDSENKIISYRDKDGILHEEVGVKTNHLFLSEEWYEELRTNTQKTYTTIKDAVDSHHIGMLQVGENIVIGLNVIDNPYTVSDIEANYKSILPNKKFPMIKSVSLHRVYDDAETPNMLYICSHSDTHIFYSICPTDTKHINYTSFEQYNSNYFYYASIKTPSELHKITLPENVGGINIKRRIKYIFEMSNGDCLIEIENGQKYNANNGHNNIYKISNVFSGNIQESDITLSLSFDVSNERISAFDQIVEYKAGHIVLAPYGAGKTAKVYISEDYGNTWDLIFCCDTNNSTHFIKPKSQHLGNDNAYGAWPTPELLVAENTVDWSATSNGNIHIHGIAYDPWYDRIWICTGDGASNINDVTGIWWTDDKGYTWKRVGGSISVSKYMGSQMMGVIPMEHCVLFSTDGNGDGYFRWARNGKDTLIDIEECYNFLGTHTGLTIVAGRSIKSKNGFVLTSFAPDNQNQGDWSYKGGIVATYNGFDFEKIYEDSFSEGNFDTAEIGWSCDITDCGDSLILKADKGGYIELKY